jgi:hypothetical protein
MGEGPTVKMTILVKVVTVASNSDEIAVLKKNGIFREKE